MRNKPLDPNETVTPEIFATWDKQTQLEYLSIDSHYLSQWILLHGEPDAAEEAELIQSGVISFASAKNKDRFSSSDWTAFLENGIVSEKEIELYFSWSQITPSDWADLLTLGGAISELSKYCDFTRFSSENWVTLLRDAPEYETLCPFELLEPEELDSILRVQPQLAVKCGLNNPFALLVSSRKTYENEDSNIPFLTFPVKDAYAIDIFQVIQSAITDDSNAIRLTLNILYYPRTLLGVYSADLAIAKQKEITTAFAGYPDLRVEVMPVGQYLEQCKNESEIAE